MKPKSPRVSHGSRHLVAGPLLRSRYGLRQSHLLVKHLLVLRHKIANARCGPSDERLDIVCEAIITISGVEARHGQEVFRDVAGQIVCTHDLVAPLIERHIDVPDGSTEGLRIFGRGTMHILSSRPGQLVDLANMSGW